ncbi:MULTISPECIES: hypothetical protein [unclassified Paenibacillus]|uniref:PD-(D/E)XK nuclease superfamily protein n=1 Tax=Paenibacillus provencensis TaxID=441151 RepID=A0ABW3Q3D8_9BACL|nr:MULTISPECIES: hypothetical protein [unclassified Paenibacillus]MCM3130996.1 hypothetical protein [Paenibacillus sp. MER 78]SDX87858.1 hypothetical protein SAMN05518848_12222 [Paenibacillus sp. PDC88]SFS99238.1 hypothetical protein SAMN04488601_1159 [Paenibacillus sp. 453mf]
MIKGLIHKTIKEIWENNISKDYHDNFLLREDSLKNAFYFHLRSSLSDLLMEQKLRIYTELNYRDINVPGSRADLAVAQLDDLNEIQEVIAVIEFKYKRSNVNERYYQEDVRKIVNLVKSSPHPIYDETYYYLAFLNETIYEPIRSEHLSYTTPSDRVVAAGRITELLGYQEDGVSTWYSIDH